MNSLEKLAEHRSYGGSTAFYRHAATSTGCAMRFGVYTPPAAAKGPVPVIYYLAGLTCNEETFLIKAGAQRMASSLGLMLVAPDTSPRDVPLPGDRDSWDFGVGAGFYVDATEQPWASHYRMATYLTDELPALIAEHLPADMTRQGIFGHSMGGHGALTLALRHPERYRSVSAFAPIAAPMHCPWGEKAFTGYLGSDRSAWQRYDATALARVATPAARARPILIDQGLADPFLARELKPELFEAACRDAGLPLTLRRHDGYDHGYYFISTFVDDHLRHHAEQLAR